MIKVPIHHRLSNGELTIALLAGLSAIAAGGVICWAHLFLFVPLILDRIQGVTECTQSFF